ncbi:hypothetical protein Dda_3729 [Drechslerella dactyloides]|uniref:Uncharacterized protein n=1 Tax=Drechslerella dactyloides TaxID=74499 RepID=A0AAD6J006_DREDA|nr:hypothetical protein Dda_3729 [Drechslerella dactyloides]
MAQRPCLLAEPWAIFFDWLSPRGFPSIACLPYLLLRSTPSVTTTAGSPLSTGFLAGPRNIIMAGRTTSLPCRLLAVFLWLLVSLEYCSLVDAQAETDGYWSEVFDPKYIPYQELLVTPKTHGGLFSFTGRWRRRRETFTASRWPGTYVTVLIYGDTCIVKLRPKPQGQILDYSFYVSVDGSDDLLYTLPPFDSLAKDREIIFVPITIPSDKPKDQQKDKTLEPHTVRIISVPDHPFSFEGFLVANTLIRQGHSWTKGQDERLQVEFIGEGIDAETYGGLLGFDHDNSAGGVGDDGGAHAVRQIVRHGVSVVNSTQFKAAEALRIRHSHADSGTCFVSDCDRRDPLPGLSVQYFNENPLPTQLRSLDLHKESKQVQDLLQKQLLFFREDQWLKQSMPAAVVVDVGVRDFLRIEEPVDPEAFRRQLLVFLGRLRESARPDATIVVIGRDWDNARSGAFKTTVRTIVPQNKNTMALRKALYQATKNATALVREEDKNVIFADIKPSNSPKRDLIDVLCTYVVPVYRPRPKSSDPNAKPSQPNTQQQICMSLKNARHGSPPKDTHEDLENAPHSTGAQLKAEEHGVPHETVHGARFMLLYGVVLVCFAIGLVYLLARPFLMVLTNLGIVRGNRRVYGVRDMETGGFGFGRVNRRRFPKEKSSLSVPMSNSGSEEEGFVVLAGGGSQSLGGRRSGKGKA